MLDTGALREEKWDTLVLMQEKYLFILMYKNLFQFWGKTYAHNLA